MQTLRVPHLEKGKNFSRQYSDFLVAILPWNRYYVTSRSTSLQGE